jgi:hypothetical protein
MTGVGQFIMESRKVGIAANQIGGDNGAMSKIMIDVWPS